MKRPATAANPPPPLTYTDPPETGTVSTRVHVGSTRMGSPVEVRKERDEWYVYVGTDRICVGTNHAYALVVASAWCAGRAICVTPHPVAQPEPAK